MSIWDLKIAIFMGMSVVCSFVLSPRLFTLPFTKKIIIYWMAMIPFIVFIRSPLITFLAVSVYLLYVSRTISPNESLAFFIAAIGAVPTWFIFKVGMGTTELYDFKHWKLLTLILLLPIFLQVLKRKITFDTVDMLIVFLVLYITASNFLFNERVPPFALFKNAIDLILYNLVVYFVFSRLVSENPKAVIQYCFVGFLILGVILSFIFIFNQFIFADLYNVHSPLKNIYGIAGAIRDIRGGFLRTEGPLAGEALGVILGATIGSLFFLRKSMGIGSLRFSLFGFLFFLGCIVTGSRGVLLSFFVVIAVFIYLRSGPLLKVLTIISGVIVFIALQNTGPVYNDEFGTFGFRAELFDAALAFVSDHPMGDVSYGASGYFDHLRRGSNQFLDIVSVYLQYLLPYGYLGLFLYVAPFIITVVQLLRFSKSSLALDNNLKEPALMFMALLVGYLVMISTVSNVGLIDIFGLLFLAIGRGILIFSNNATRS